MKLESFKGQSQEVFIDSGDISVTVHTWANLEGVSFMVHGRGPELPLRLAGAFKWEEIDVLIAALTLARAG